MVTETVKFDHSAEDISSVFGISKQRAMEITGSIFFTEIDKVYAVHSLFGNPEEAPKEFTTKTGILDAVLGEVNNDSEALFATYEWGKHITLSNSNEDYKMMCGMEMTMLYMMTGQDKDKFLAEFVKRAESAEESED